MPPRSLLHDLKLKQAPSLARGIIRVQPGGPECTPDVAAPLLHNQDTCTVTHPEWLFPSLAGFSTFVQWVLVINTVTTGISPR